MKAHSPQWEERDGYVDLFGLSPLSSVEGDTDTDIEPLSLSPSYSVAQPIEVSVSNSPQLCGRQGTIQGGNDLAAPGFPSHYAPPHLNATAPADNTDHAAIPHSPEMNNRAAQQRARKRQRRVRNHQNRKEGRREAQDRTFSHHQSRDNVRLDSAPPILTSMATERGSTTTTGFVGLNDVPASRKLYDLSDFVGEGSRGFQYIAWDGECVISLPE